jgi:3-oxoacyl-[acyl-carrier protein] reductase
MELQGKVALVLGAIKGIGKEIGLALAKQGVKVALNYFDWEEELEGLKQDFADTGRPHLILKTNLLEVEKTTGLIQRVVDHFGRLDILHQQHRTRRLARCSRTLYTGTVGP